MTNHVTKDQRVAALEKAKAQNLERFYALTTELDTIKSNLDVLNAQLIVLQGLTDPAPATTEVANGQ